jgi:LmbE family N-acetylglucosaminyl deacetylase
MKNSLKLLCVLAHPDDESLGVGGTIARYTAEGVEVSLLMSTRGQRGWQGKAEENPGLTTLGEIRERELEAAAEVFRLKELAFLDYLDGDLDQADPAKVIAEIASYVRRIRPQVVVTFPPDGGYGHPDHIAVCQFTTAALALASNPDYEPQLGQSHQVSKLYYRVWSREEQAVYEMAFGDMVFEVDGVLRSSVGWDDWAITTWVDTEAYWPTVWQAISCHQSQLKEYQKLANLPEDHHKALWGCQRFYRVYSTVNGGRHVESDLFEGLR